MQWNRETYVGDAKPREVFIALCLLVPIIGVGVYPKLATQTYDSTTVAIAHQVRQVVAQERVNTYSHRLPTFPTILGAID